MSLSVAVLGTLAVLSAGALIATSSALQRTTADVAAAVESVRLVEEAELSLLLHGRARDPVVQKDIENELRAALHRTQAFVTTASERGVLDEVVAKTDAYFVAARQRDEAAILEAESSAFEALEELVAVNLEHTRVAHRDATVWGQIANVMGISLGVSIVVIAVALILWLRRQVTPLFALAETVRRFGEGERHVRAPASGPRELQEMTHRFNEMADAIVAQRQAQVAFVGGVAHDLRTPLSALGLAVDMLDPAEPLPAEPQLRRLVEVIARQIHHLERMVGDFVDMATTEGGKLELVVGRHDVSQLVRDSVGVFAQSAQRIVLSAPAACCAVCDPVRIGQAVTNLVSNAIKYSPDGTPIDVRVHTRAGDAIIEVSDRGAGIAPEDQARIFEPFRRVGGKQLATGAGLGLFNVKRIVEAHDGRIEVESAPGEGSTFRIHLPLEP